MKPEDSQQSRPWSDLPEGVLEAIGKKRASSRLEILRLRSVCRFWRSAIPLPKPPPSKLIFRSTLPRSSKPDLCTVFSSTVYMLVPLAGEPDPWVLRVEETRDRKFRPVFPLTRNYFCVLPRGFSNGINLLDFRVVELSKVYHFEASRVNENDFDVYKCVVSPVPSTPGGDDYTVLVSTMRQLWFSRVGDDRWSSVNGLHGCADVVWHKGRFYAVDNEGTLFVVDSDFRARQLTRRMYYRHLTYNKYLLSSGGDLFLTHTGTDIERDFVRIFKLDVEEKAWEVVDCLGDKVFFLSFEGSFSFSARDIGREEGNMIFLRHPPKGEKYTGGCFPLYGFEWRRLLTSGSPFQVFIVSHLSRLAS